MSIVKKNALRLRLRDQRRWIEGHGSDLAGYIYCYGEDQGPAIYHADLGALQQIQSELAATA